MTKWYDRIGNEIKMIVPVDHGQFNVIVGTVYAGERSRDGIVSMRGEDGKDYFCGVDNWTLQKTENTLPDLLTNADRIRQMTDEELNTFLWAWKINSLASFMEEGGAGLMNAVGQLEWLQEEAGKLTPREATPWNGGE